MDGEYETFFTICQRHLAVRRYDLGRADRHQDDDGRLAAPAGCSLDLVDVSMDPAPRRYAPVWLAGCEPLTSSEAGGDPQAAEGGEVG